jgi:hypothetical protein
MFNNAGFTDIAWQNTSTGELTNWQIAGTTVSSPGVIADLPSAWHVGNSADEQVPAAAYDFYGAGTSNILWQNSSTNAIAIWQITGTTAPPAAEINLGTIPTGWSAAGVGDFYGNGMASILYTNSLTNQVALWKMDGATPLSETEIATVPVGWQVAGVDDFNNYGVSDILWQNTLTNQIAIWEMNGATPTSEQTIATLPTGWQVVGTGNFYGPGDAGILFQNSVTNQVAIWKMSGTTPISEQTIATVPQGWQVAGTGDFYGDGYDDILWFNSSTNQVAMWEMNGATPVAETTIATVPSGWTVAEVGHITGGSDADILWQNSSTGQVALWQMNGATPIAETTLITVPGTTMTTVPATGTSSTPLLRPDIKTRSHGTTRSTLTLFGSFPPLFSIRHDLCNISRVGLLGVILVIRLSRPIVIPVLRSCNESAFGLSPKSVWVSCRLSISCGDGKFSQCPPVWRGRRWRQR